ncbi:MAG: hypothetical protein ACO1TE_18645 [Prosthecobacter sp.]
MNIRTRTSFSVAGGKLGTGLGDFVSAEVDFFFFFAAAAMPAVLSLPLCFGKPSWSRFLPSVFFLPTIKRLDVGGAACWMRFLNVAHDIRNDLRHLDLYHGNNSSTD